ncbi:MAG: VWA domain-containing protein [Ilumatobacteraceae bacterium]
MTTRPGTRLARRPLHFILVLDCSGSMAADGKIRALNTAVREVLPHLAHVAGENPHAELLFSALAFSTGVNWHVDPPQPIDDVVWEDLTAGGYTDMGAALMSVAERVAISTMGERAMPPAIVLVSDGQPTDDFEGGLRRLLDEPFGAAAARIAVAIGRDVDRDILVRFQGGGEPLLAHNPEQLVTSIRWASAAVTRAASELAPPPPGAFGPVAWHSADIDMDDALW